MSYKYSWTKNHSVSPQIAGEIIQKLRTRSADNLLKEAKKKSSPLHGQFEWDDSIAANQHRLHQARTMINSLQIEVINNKSKPQTIHAFVRKADKGKLYIPILEADEADITAAELRCLDQMRIFKAKWKNLVFARDVVSEITAVEVSAARRRRA